MVEAIKDMNKIKDIENYLRKHNDRDAIMFLTGIKLGLRMSDILNLRVKDVYDKEKIKVNQIKTGKEVLIEIPPKLRKDYKIYCKNKKMNDYLISNQRRIESSPITRDRAYNILKKVAKKFGVKNVGTHTLRKTYGYLVYNQNEKNLALVMECLGQTNPSSTLRYIGIDNIDKKKAARRIDF